VGDFVFAWAERVDRMGGCEAGCGCALAAGCNVDPAGGECCGAAGESKVSRLVCCGEEGFGGQQVVSGGCPVLGDVGEQVRLVGVEGLQVSVLALYLG